MKYLKSLLMCVYALLAFVSFGRIYATDPTRSITLEKVRGAAVTENNYTSTAGNWGNSGASSVESFKGDGSLDFRIDSTFKEIAVGLSNENRNDSFFSTDYALFFLNDFVRIYEKGVFKGNFVNFSESDQFQIQRIGSTIHYSKNGNSFYTSLIESPAEDRLLVDISSKNIGASISNIEFKGVDNATISQINHLKATSQNEGVELLWDTPTLISGNILSYTIEYGLAQGEYDQSLSVSATNHIVSGLTNNQEYKFRVSVVADIFTSASSNEAKVTPQQNVNATWEDIHGAE